MGQTKSPRDKNLNRPKKNATDRRRREKVHRQRLVALGVSEAKVKKLDASAVRQMLKWPAKIKG